MISLSPIYLTLYGLILNFIGSILVSFEAINAKFFLDKYKNEDTTTSRLAWVGLVSTLNGTFVYLFISILSVSILQYYLRYFNLVPNIIIASSVFFIWQFLNKIINKIYSLFRKLNPEKLYKKNKFTYIIGLIWGIPWILFFLSIFIINVIMNNLSKLILYFTSEKMFKPFVIMILKRIAIIEEKNKRFYFKKEIFHGFLFLIFGFLIQIISIILQLLTVK